MIVDAMMRAMRMTRLCDSLQVVRCLSAGPAPFFGKFPKAMRNPYVTLTSTLT